MLMLNDADGNTPLMVAQKAGNQRAVEILRKHGGQVNVVGGKTALHMDAIHNSSLHLKDIREHQQSGAELDAQDTDGNTPLHYARAFTRSALIDAGANPNIQNNKGQTVLDLAVEKSIEEDDTYWVKQILESRKKPTQYHTVFGPVKQDKTRTPVTNETIQKALQTKGITPAIKKMLLDALPLKERMKYYTRYDKVKSSLTSAQKWVADLPGKARERYRAWRSKDVTAEGASASVQPKWWELKKRWDNWQVQRKLKGLEGQPKGRQAGFV